MENIDILPVSLKDVQGINHLRTSQGVFETIYSLESERTDSNEQFIQSLTSDDHIFVAKENGHIRGMISLQVNKIPRQRHSAKIGLMIARDHQKKGIGTSLLAKVIDLADNWLMLVRLELTVFRENSHAVHLYEKFGFRIEGTKVKSCVKNGVYADEYYMSRIRNS